jgi:hypothetical protein
VTDYLWRQEPLLSSAPEETLKYSLNETAESVCEAAVFKLGNGKYLFIRFVSDFKDDLEVGFTDAEEFDTLEEAVTLYTETIGD